MGRPMELGWQEEEGVQRGFVLDQVFGGSAPMHAKRMVAGDETCRCFVAAPLRVQMQYRSGRNDSYPLRANLGGGHLKGLGESTPMQQNQKSKKCQKNLPSKNLILNLKTYH